ncbi:PepSY domain-containing protein [Nitrososphaera viennensis]|nr:PepSY domain-containing protein [Nitrososphaera viennensis]UVS68407.1 PepSY domain-containing protein [Nitrososphaera viennensis]
MENNDNNKRTFYALVLGALAVAAAVGSIAAASVSFASAQTAAPDNENAATKANVVAFKASSAADMLYQKFAPIPDIKGSVNAGDELMSKVQVSFSDAAKTAADAASGTVIGGNLAVEQGYLVYSFRVLSGDQAKTVIVDAGNGQVLHTSEGFPADIMSEISGRGTFFAPAVKAFSVTAATPDEEGQQQ